MLIKTIDQIVSERERDTYWIRFARVPLIDRDALCRAKEDQLAWFNEKDLNYQIAAPQGWLEGDPGCFAVDFSGPDDPRLDAYGTRYEQPDGRSLEPDLYQMYLVPFGAAITKTMPSTPTPRELLNSRLRPRYSEPLAPSAIQK